MKLRKILAVAIWWSSLPLISACSTQSTVEIPAEQEVVLERDTFSFDQDTAQDDLFVTYKIHPGDVLDVLFQIRTWIKKDRFNVAVDHTVAVKFVNAPELNETQRVRPDGRISLPYIGEYYVVGKSVGEIQQELTRLYSKELRKPDLYVLIPEFREAIKELKKDLHTAPRGLSRLVTVRPDGFVTFPMVGEMRVASHTITEINEELNRHYEQILPGLHVDLFLQEHSGSLIYILGEVTKPGAYPIAKPINLLQAASLAQSFTARAQLDSVVVVRRHEGKMVARRVDMSKTVQFGSGKELFYLRPDDIIYVPKTRLSSAADVARDLASLLFFRGWSINVRANP